MIYIFYICRVAPGSITFALIQTGNCSTKYKVQVVFYLDRHKVKGEII